MTLLEKIRIVAEWLRSEARRRILYGKRFVGAFDFVECSGEVAIDFYGPSGETAKAAERGKKFCTISTYPWQPCALLAFARERYAGGNDPTQEREVRVIVYFGDQPELDVTGETETEKQGKRRLMRNLLRRAQKAGNLSTHVMIIDELTPRRAIEEQISLFLAKQRVLDESTTEVLGMKSSKPVSVETGMHLVERFIDPLSPKSYPAYKKTLRLRVAGPEETRKGRVDDEDLKEHILAHASGREWYARPESEYEGLEGIEPQGFGTRPQRNDDDLANIRKEAETRNRGRRNVPEHPTAKGSCSVREAADIIGVPWRTLYRWVGEGGVEVDRDKWGRVRIPLAELEKLRGRAEDRTNRKAALSLVAGLRDIKPASARKRIRRAAKSGKTVDAVVREAVAGSRPTSSRDRPCR